MRKTLLGSWCVLVCTATLWTPCAARAESDAASVKPADLQAVANSETILFDDRDLSEIVPLAEISTIMEHHPGGATITRGVTPGPDDVLIYSNTFGTDLWRPQPTGIRVADDIVTDAVSTCNITSFKIRVNGGIPDGDEEFSVQLRVWDGCPGLTNSSIIPGTDLLFDGLEDDDTIVHDLFLPANILPIELPPTIWIQVSFSTRRSGWVVGTPATVGFSGDLYHHPFTGCNTWFGGWPTFPHASGYAEIFADPTCETHFLAYRAASPSAPTFIHPAGPNGQTADDLILIVDDCELSAYEVGMRGVAGPYQMTMDLRVAPEGNAIAGTESVFDGKGEGSIEVSRFTVDAETQIMIPAQVWMVWQPNKTGTGVINAGRTQAGRSLPTYAATNVLGEPGWTRNLTFSNRDAAFYISIFCRGDAPRGACCPAQEPGATEVECIEDVTVLSCTSPDPRCAGILDCPDARWSKDRCCGDNCCVGGDENNRTCVNTFDCPGGSCVAAGTPPAFDPPCGAHSCCQPGEGGKQCDDFFWDECVAITEPAEDERPCETDRECPGTRLCMGNGFCDPKRSRWFSGEFCSVFQFECPFFACFDGEGDCFSAEAETVCDSNDDCPGFRKCLLPQERICEERVGCGNLQCCDRICGSNQSGGFCCEVGWDGICSGLAAQFCADLEPGNDFCFDNRRPSLGAIEIPLNDFGFGFAEGNNSGATLDKPVPEPGFCCHNLGVNRKALGTMWYWFEATGTSSRLDTCEAVGGGASDTLLQVFSVGNPDRGLCVDGSVCSVAGRDCADDTTCQFDRQNACDTIEVIGCSDDAGGNCGPDGKNSSVCLTNLTIGDRYYVLIGAQTGLDTGTFRITLRTPCPDSPPTNNTCVTANTFIQSPSFFDLEDSTLDCPATECATMKNDVWKLYTASCTGLMIAHTCAGTAAASPATAIVVYQAGGAQEAVCNDPDREVDFPEGLRLGCNDDADFDKVCTFSGDACERINDCKGKTCSNLDPCFINADCDSGTCELRSGAQTERACSISGLACKDVSDCTVGVCANNLVDPCDTSTSNTCPFKFNRCVADPGVFCQSDQDCTDAGAGDVCERWPCVARETCDDAECLSSVCGRSAFVEAAVFAGQQYLIRLGSELGEDLTGQLTIECIEDDCNDNGGPDLFDILVGISADCNGNGEPDECEILRDSVTGMLTYCDANCDDDCNTNGTLDVCEINISSSAAHCDDESACIVGGSPCSDGSACVGGIGTYFCPGFGCDPDTDNNGIPDDCGAGNNACTTLVATSPPNCSIDARQPSTIDGVTVQGWTSMDVTVGPPGCTVDLAGMTVNSVPSGPAPVMISMGRSVDLVTVSFDAVIPDRNWTCVALASDGTQQACIGNLPGDVNSDGTSNPALDLGALIDCINNPGSCLAWQENIDRTGAGAGVLDITRVIDLFNGAGSFQSFTGASFSGTSCPSAP